MMSYFCTGGRGTEVFLKEEIETKWNLNDVQCLDGKVIFSAPNAMPSELLGLKCAERLFICVLYRSGFSLPRGRRKEGLDLLSNTVSGITGWMDAYTLWKQFQEQLPGANFLPVAKSTSGSKQSGIGSEQSTSGSEHSIHCSEQSASGNDQSTRGSEQSTSGGEQIASGSELRPSCKYVEDTGQESKANLERKRKNTETVNEANDRTMQLKSESQQCVTKEEEVSNKKMKTDDSIGKSVKLNNHISLNGNNVNSGKNTNNQSVDNLNVCKLNENMIEGLDNGEPCVSFRVSCKASGSARSYHFKELSQVIAKAVSMKTSWEINLKAPSLEIYVHIRENEIFIGIPVTRIPLSNRKYIKYIGLRSTVCWIMGYLGAIKAGDIVLDPMCGAGTILIEARHSQPNTVYIGMDKSKSQVDIAHENVTFAHQENGIMLIQNDCANIALKDKSVDIILCDMPFGMKYSNQDDVNELYSVTVPEMKRVIKDGGRIVILTSIGLVKSVIGLFDSTYAESKEMDAKRRQMDIENTPGDWKLERKCNLKLGFTEACVCVFIKHQLEVK